MVRRAAWTLGGTYGSLHLAVEDADAEECQRILRSLAAIDGDQRTREGVRRRKLPSGRRRVCVKMTEARFIT